jgi:type I restriction enzyme S subunit
MMPEVVEPKTCQRTSHLRNISATILGAARSSWILVPLPSRETQATLLEVKTAVNGLERLQAESSAELGALMPSILDKAFRGEL